MRAFLLFAQQVINESDIPNVPKPPLTEASISTVLQIVFGFAGAIAVIILILAGLKYNLSLGDPQKTAQAKNAIIYAAVGLAVCVLAFSIVSLIVGAVK